MKYNQKFYSTTEYNEAIALSHYCKINNLDFYNIIKSRKDKNSFPDFKINDRLCLEVARISNNTIGKREGDVQEVFGSEKDNKVVEINSKLSKKYKGNHRIYFKNINNVTCGIYRDFCSKAYAIFCAATIIKKYKKYVKNKKDINVDLFLICHSAIKEEDLRNLYNWYTNEKCSSYFNNVYLLYLSNLNNILIMGKGRFEIIDNIKKEYKDEEIFKLICDLNWLKEEKYINK